MDDVTIKRDLKFRLKIDIKEAKIVLLNSTNNKLILSNGKILIILIIILGCQL